MTARVAVVVPTHRRAHRLPALVAALEAQTLPVDDFEVIVVEDGGTDATQRVLAELAVRSPLRLRPMRLDPNRGPAWARNAGWRSSDAPVLAFTDDDCLPTPEWLEAGLTVMEADDLLGIAQGRTDPDPAARVEAWWATTRSVQEQSYLFEGCNLFVRRVALEATGGFDEGLGFHAEDTALGWAIVDAGWRSTFVPGAVVHHGVTDTGVRWHVDRGFHEGHLVKVARDHPRIRTAVFWQPWCVRPRNAAFAAAVVGLALAPRWRAAALAGLPYAWYRRPRSLSRAGAELLAGQLAVDAATFAGMVAASVRWRRLVL